MDLHVVVTDVRHRTIIHFASTGPDCGACRCLPLGADGTLRRSSTVARRSASKTRHSRGGPIANTRLCRRTRRRRSAARVTPVAEASRTAVRGLGCAPIGDLYTAVDPEVAVATVHRALALGSTLLDTAPKYDNGLSELRLGQAIAPFDRNSYQLSTKVGWSIAVGRPPVPAFDADGVLRSPEGSMRRLGTDHFDIVHVHDPDDHLDQAVAETMPALVRLRDEGVIGSIGASMNSDRLLAELVRRTDLDRVLIAGRYTLQEQGATAPARASRSSVVATDCIESQPLAAEELNAGPAEQPMSAWFVNLLEGLCDCVVEDSVDTAAEIQQAVELRARVRQPVGYRRPVNDRTFSSKAWSRNGGSVAAVRVVSR
ncbi:aldo/keto reductase [Streptomyces sp. NPDC090083]|uniref:aldo/keto reductase n=1 Tax=Streptomyces sp. NPDC090083 TaxID=3365941 RepID=UPI003804FB48